jgi:hypothetical protein
LRTFSLPKPSMTVISTFLAPVWTTSSSDLTVSLIVSSRVMSSRWFFSRNSRIVFDERPTAFAWRKNDRRVSASAAQEVALRATHLPRRVDARGFCQVEPRDVVVRVESDEQARDAERPDATRLRVALLAEARWREG